MRGGALDRRGFLALGAAAALPGCMPAAALPAASSLPAGSTAPFVAPPHAELEEATIADLAARLARGDLTSVALLDAYAARIATLDRAGPMLHAILELDPDARAAAARLDEERRAGRVRGPLHGIPVLVKDNVDTAGRTQTSAGSLALAGAPAPRDAHLVTRLREAGAVLLGKANLSEWANIRDAHSVSGWSARGGLTKNPYALDRNTSGSSSGSAAAVAASLCAVAVGTETNGSIMSPSQIQGLVGVKPTVGLVSRAGIIPISHTQDTAGPMARTVADAAILLAAFAGADPADPATAHIGVLPPAQLARGGVRGKRIGVLRPGWMGPSVKPAFEGAMETLRRLGAVLVDLEPPKPPPEYDDAELTVLLYELKTDLAAYLATRGHPGMRTLEDVIRFNREHAREELAVFGQDLFEKAAAKGGLDAKEYVDALALCRRTARDEGIDAMLRGHQLDALTAPTGGPAWLTDFVNGDATTGAGYEMAAIAGYPSVTVPCGAAKGLPLGVCFLAGAWSEGVLLGIAFDYEQESRHRGAPTYAASTAMGV
ncbi:MAG TPA: amidase [Polyangiaceae bacterium]